MQRRAFITLLGGAAAAWPVAAEAQQEAMPVIGYLQLTSPETAASNFVPFRKGLGEAGYVEGRNVTIEYRWAHNDSDRLPELAADLVSRRVSVIAAIGSTAAALAAKAATTTLPIVFASGIDPVQLGPVATYNRPGGNVTGVVTMNSELGPKRLGLLHQLLPCAARFGALVNPSEANADPLIKELQTAAPTIGVQIEVFHASTSRDISTSFVQLVQRRLDALLVSPGPLFGARRVQLQTLAARHVLPVIYGSRENVEAGGLMSYSSNGADVFRQAGLYVARILRGEKPADLPVERPTKFEFIINLATADALGIRVPPTLLAIADEVIE